MDYREKQDYKKQQRGSHSLLAVALIVIGTLFLLRNFGLIPYPLTRFIFSWQMLLIAMGGYFFLKKESTPAIILLVIGTYFILPKFSLLFPHMGLNIRSLTKNTWPILLVVLGLYIYFKNIYKSEYKARVWEQGKDSNPDSLNPSDTEEGARQGSEVPDDSIDETLVFSSSFKHILSQNIVGGQVNVVFGQAIVDLRRANLKDNRAVLKIDNVFASTIVYVPKHWRVDINSQVIMGSFTDKRVYSSTPKEPMKEAPLLIIVGSCVLGSGEIRV